MRTRRLSAVVLLVVALAGACSSSGGDASSRTNQPPGSGPIDAAKVLDFSLPSVEGPTIDGADYSGKALALWFWAPW